MSAPSNAAELFHLNLSDVVSTIGLHQHVCLIYESEQEQFAAALPFVKRGLDYGEKCLYVADENTTETTLRRARDFGLNVDHAIASGSFELVRKHDSYIRGGSFDPDAMIAYLEAVAADATAAGYSGVRVLGEMTWALEAHLTGERLFEFESKLNAFVAARPATVVCQYNKRLFSPEIILGVIKTHPLVVYGGEVNNNPYYMPPEEFLNPGHTQRELDRLLGNIRAWNLAEVTLREMRDRFQTAFTYAPVGIVMLNREGRILDANPAYSSITGYAPDELRETSIQSLTHPEDLAVYRSLWERLIHREIPAFVFEKRYVTKTGQSFWDRQTVCPAVLNTADAMPALVIAVVEDVEERRRVELERARLAAIVEKASDFIAICDLDQRMMYVNPAGRKMVGLASLEEARRTTVSDYFLPEDAQFVAKEVVPALLEKGSWSGELKFRHFRTGAVIPIEVYHSFTIDDPETGKPINFATVSRDITERKRSEQQLQRSYQDLRALAARMQTAREQERTRVAREIHDELGQALAAIKIDLTSFIRDLPLNEAKAAKADSILRVVNNTLSSVRRVATELRPSILDDLGLVAALDWAAEDFETRTGIRVSKKLPEEIVVEGERATALFRIFQETLTNIALHSGATEVSIELKDENGDISLEVHDNGRGISEQKLSAPDSIGILGMRERASLLGGELTITAAPGAGTTVRVRLPHAPLARAAP